MITPEEAFTAAMEQRAEFWKAWPEKNAMVLRYVDERVRRAAERGHTETRISAEELWKHGGLEGAGELLCLTTYLTRLGFRARRDFEFEAGFLLWGGGRKYTGVEIAWDNDAPRL